MSTNELLERAEAVRTRLRARLEALPDADDATTERLRMAVMSGALNLRSLEGRVYSLVQRVENPKPAHDLKPWVAWRDMLTEAQAHFELELSAFEALPRREQNRRYNELHAVRRALQVIAFGANTEEGESLILETWLRERGVLPLWGQRLIFAGRGGLRSTRQRISHIEKRLADTVTSLENVLTTADAMLAEPEVTASRSTATV